MADVPRCRACGAENAADLPYCGACGKKFVAREADVPVTGDNGAFYCFKHTKEVTRLRCSHCEKPICTRCAVIGPAGVKCKTCSRNKIPITARGIVHDVTGGAKGAVSRFGARPVWYLMIWGFIIRLIAGFFGRW
jgi:hypothetical protein